MENRVLTLSEVLALPEGARVWVEHNYSALSVRFPDGIHRMGSYMGEKALRDNWGPWALESNEFGDFGKKYRVWSLPQPPTAEELAAHPWPEVQHGAEKHIAQD